MKTKVVPQMLACVLMFTVPASLAAQSATPAALRQAATLDWNSVIELKTGSNIVRFEQGDATLRYRKTGTWKGLVIGAAAGAGLGVLRARNTRSAFRDPVQNALIGSGIGAGIGAVFGKLLGADEFRVTYRPR